MNFIDSLKINLPKDTSEDKFHSALRELTLLKRFVDYDGAVTILFFRTGETVFIKRSESMAHHRGQIAFIGGRKEAYDKSPIDNAFREFNEETGISADNLDLLGITPPVIAGSGLRIIAVACEVKMELSEFKQVVESNGEWDFMFTVPWSNFEDLNSWAIASRYGAHTNGRLLYRPILSSEWEILKDYRENSNMGTLHFWGASARMLWNLYRMNQVPLQHI